VVVRPGCGVGLDVLADAGEVFFVADYVFVVVALPYRDAGSVAQGVDAPGRSAFEAADERSDGSGRAV
jgi:hypothetical protein